MTKQETMLWYVEIIAFIVSLTECSSMTGPYQSLFVVGCSVFKLSDLDRLISNAFSRTDQAGKVGSQSKLSLLAISYSNSTT